MSTLKAWRQVAVPHRDIRDGKFDSSVFAADLGEVLAGRGAVDYRDAATFFAKTYLTGGLSQLVIDVIRSGWPAGKTNRSSTSNGLRRRQDAYAVDALPPGEKANEPCRQAARHPEALPRRRPEADPHRPGGLPGRDRHRRDRQSNLLGRTGLPAWRRPRGTALRKLAKSDEKKSAQGTNLLANCSTRPARA